MVPTKILRRPWPGLKFESHVWYGVRPELYVKKCVCVFLQCSIAVRNIDGTGKVFFLLSCEGLTQDGLILLLWLYGRDKRELWPKAVIGQNSLPSGHELREGNPWSPPTIPKMETPTSLLFFKSPLPPQNARDPAINSLRVGHPAQLHQPKTFWDLKGGGLILSEQHRKWPLSVYWRLPSWSRQCRRRGQSYFLQIPYVQLCEIAGILICPLL